jgi:enamine deaminase RidA (YjgF/YER057c/UK114 family)
MGGATTRSCECRCSCGPEVSPSLRAAVKVFTTIPRQTARDLAGCLDARMAESPPDLRRVTTMPRQLISSGSSFEKSIGYSRAVVDGDWIFVSGTTGFDYSTMTIEADVVSQCRQALRNIAAALEQAGASLRDVVRVHYLLTDAAEFEACWPVMGQAFGDIRPSCTAMVVGLVDPRMKIEIEVTALRRRASGKGTKPVARKAKAKPATKAARQAKRKK